MAAADASADSVASLGLDAAAVEAWLAPRHALLRTEVGGNAYHTEAVVVYEGDVPVLFVPAAAAPVGAQVILVGAQGDDGEDEGTLVHGVYTTLDPLSFEELPPGAVAEDLIARFDASGASPSLGQVSLHVPVSFLPEDVQDEMAEAALRDQVDEEDFAEVGGGGMPPHAPLFPVPVDMGPTGHLFGDPAAGRGSGTAPPPPGGAVGGVPPGSCGRGAPRSAAPPAMPLPPAGRGRAPAARNAGRGGRPTLAALSAQLTEGFALLQASQVQLGERVTQLERGGPGAVTPLAAPLPGSAGPRAFPAAAAEPPAAAPTAASRSGEPSGRSGGIGSIIGSLLPRAFSPPRGAEPTVGPPPLAAPPAPALRASAAPPGLATHGAARPAAKAPAAVRASPPPAGLGTALGGAGAHAAARPRASPTSMAAAAATAGDPAMTAVMESLMAQSRMLASLARSSGEGLDTAESEVPTGLRGPRSATVLKEWRTALRQNPRAITQRVKANRDLALQGAAEVPGGVPTFRSYLASEVPFGKAKTAAYLLFGLADVTDLLGAGRADEAEALAVMLLSAGEQAALHSWQWGLAWMMAFPADPPWNRIARSPTPEDARALSRLADPSLVSATVAYFRDITAVQEAQRKVGTHAGGPPHGDADDDGNQAKGKPRKKRPAAGDGTGKDAPAEGAKGAGK